MVPLQHPIQVVSRLTGLSPHVIRVWEKRYSAVTPERTGSNRRLYSDGEVERLRLLARATEAGHRIGIIARLSTEDLRRLVATVLPGSEATGMKADEQSGTSVAGVGGKDPEAGETGLAGAEGGDARALVAEALAATRGFRSEALRRALEQGVVRFGQNGVLHRVVHPLAREVGELWQSGMITAAHEHFASALIREFLLTGARPYALGEGAPRAVVATPSGQLHELGAVMAAAVASNVGWRTIYLGPSLPAAEIAGAAIQNRARAVLISLVYPADDPQVATELSQLRRYLPADVSIIAGGRAAAAYASALAGIQARVPAGLQELCALLEELRGVRSE